MTNGYIYLQKTYSDDPSVMIKKLNQLFETIGSFIA